MKKLIFTIGCIFVMNLSSCFSQLLENNNKVFKSATRYVFGNSKDFTELYLGITFGKVINLVDTSFFIKFQLHAPNSEFRNNIQIKKTSAITFLSKRGKAVNLKLTDVISLTEKESEKQIPLPTTQTTHSTILILNVTKENFIEIGSEPFYNLIIPFYNISTKVENSAIFEKPTLFTPRTFTQKNIKDILDI